MLIRLEHVNPPIPDRRHDWLAYDDDDPENTAMQGWGRTQWEALREFADRLEEEDDE